MFVVVDLFLNVEEFDAVRPRANLYHAMRQIAHDMVGERVDTEVVGRVVDADGQPVVPAEIALVRGLRLVPDANVDDAGYFDLKIDGPLAHDALEATAPGYMPSRHYVHEGFQRITVVLQRLPAIRGRVRLADNSSPREFEVIFARVGSDALLQPPGPFGSELDHSVQLRRFGDASGDGEFLIEGLEPVGYTLVVRAPGCAVVRLSGVVPQPRETAQRLEVVLPRSPPQ